MFDCRQVICTRYSEILIGNLTLQIGLSTYFLSFRPVGETSEIFIHISGFSELPDLRVLPKAINLHDVVVGETENLAVTLYNYGSCYFTSKLYHIIDGMGDEFSGDRFEIDSTVVSQLYIIIISN